MDSRRVADDGELAAGEVLRFDGRRQEAATDGNRELDAAGNRSGAIAESGSVGAMSLKLQLRNGLRVLTRRKAADRELDEEAQHFLAETAAALEAQGLSAEDAARRAKLECGSALAICEQVREAGWEDQISGLLTDVKIAARRLARTPGFTFAAGATLALGIGATAAIFSIVDAVVLRPLPYPVSNRLVALEHSAPGINFATLTMSPSLYFTYKEESRAFESLALWNGGRVTVTGLSEPREEHVLTVTHEFLRVLKVDPQLGRGFTAADDDPANPRTVILSDGYWRSQFAGAIDVLGRSITVDGNPYLVVGVLPRRFEFMDEDISFVLPMRLRRGETRLGGYGDEGIARLRPGITLGQANADIARCLPIVIAKFGADQMKVNFFSAAKIGAKLRPLEARLVGDLGRTLTVLIGAAGMLLLVACANVANLLLVRADGRRREMAVRIALGAAWGRIAREFLVESCLLGIVGGVLGLLLCAGTLRVLKMLSFVSLPRLGSIEVNGFTLLFTFVLAMATSVVFGLAPLGRNARVDLLEGTRTGAGRTASSNRQEGSFRAALVVIQVGLATVLLVGSLLMIRTFQQLRNVDPGFTRPEAVEAVRVSIPEALIAEPARALAIEKEIVRHFAAVPGVVSVAATTSLPLEGGSFNPVAIEGRSYPPNTLPPVRRMRSISPGLPAVLGKPLVAGRDFRWDEIDRDNSVVIVSENMSREVWGSPQGAIGKRIGGVDQPHFWHEVVGVSADLRDGGLMRPAPTIVYWPLNRKFGEGKLRVSRNLDYLIRSERAGSNSFAEELRLALKSVNPNLPLANVRTLEKPYKRSLARTSLTMSLLGTAGVMALALGIVGVYGVLSYAVALRTRDIGIRIALGCAPGAVMRLFLRRGLILSAVGSACGICAALVLTRFLRSMLFGVSPLDTLSFAIVLLCLLSASLAASWLPARRAASTDPAEALRAE